MSSYPLLLVHETLEQFVDIAYEDADYPRTLAHVRTHDNKTLSMGARYADRRQAELNREQQPMDIDSLARLAGVQGFVLVPSSSTPLVEKGSAITRANILGALADLDKVVDDFNADAIAIRCDVLKTLQTGFSDAYPLEKWIEKMKCDFAGARLDRLVIKCDLVIDPDAKDYQSLAPEVKAGLQAKRKAIVTRLQGIEKDLTEMISQVKTVRLLYLCCSGCCANDTASKRTAPICLSGKKTM